jgi:hypothetical protein
MHIRHHTDEWGIEVYIDDIIIGAHSADALADAIDWLLERCAELRLTLSCRKSTIGTHAMKVLGKMVKYQLDRTHRRANRRHSRLQPADHRWRAALIPRHDGADCLACTHSQDCRDQLAAHRGI